MTGGFGYVGTHTIVEIMENDKCGFNKIIVCDYKFNPQTAANIRKAAGGQDDDLVFEEIDIRDEQKLDRIFIKYRPIKSVLNLAGVRRANQKSMLDDNVGRYVSLVRVMDTHDCHNFVFASSAAVYGDFNMDLIEEHPIKPVIPLGKIMKLVE